jgi:hypothetical protein
VHYESVPDKQHDDRTQRRTDQSRTLIMPIPSNALANERSDESSDDPDHHRDKIPAWLKSLWDMENELRSAARNGLILRKDEASAHLAEARRHLEKAMNEAKGIEPANGPQTPLRKEGEI